MSVQDQVEWRPIAGYANYEVSNQGNVRNAKTQEVLKSHVSTNGYYSVRLYSYTGTKNFLMHRLVALAFIDNPLNKPCVDHRDRNVLNNNVSNLRWCTVNQNAQNVEIRKTNTSGYRGVSFHKGNKKWRACIKNDGKHIHIGYYRTAEEAHVAYDAAARVLFGEFFHPPPPPMQKIQVTVIIKNSK